jgi:hypothetical protein
MEIQTFLTDHSLQKMPRIYSRDEIIALFNAALKNGYLADIRNVLEIK